MEINQKQFQRIRAYYKVLLPELTDEAWQYCCENFSIRQVKKGEHIVREGQICKSVSFVDSGMTYAYRLHEGKEMIIGFFPENTYVSEYSSFLERTPATYFIDALEDTVLIDFNYEQIQQGYNRYKELERFGRLIAEYLYRMLDGRVYSLHSLSAEQRYTLLLDSNPSVFQHVPQYMIASYLGITPEALSRIRKRMAS